MAEVNLRSRREVAINVTAITTVIMVTIITDNIATISPTYKKMYILIFKWLNFSSNIKNGENFLVFNKKAIQLEASFMIK